MRYFVLFFMVLFSLFSCKEETLYQTRLIFENSTQDTVIVKFFPKDQFVYKDMYRMSSFEGGYIPQTTNLAATELLSVYVVDKLGQKASALVSEIFDSIQIQLKVEPLIIQFSADSSINSALNIFIDDAIWNYTNSEFDNPTQLKKHPTYSDDYTYTIDLINN